MLMTFIRESIRRVPFLACAGVLCLACLPAQADPAIPACGERSEDFNPIKEELKYEALPKTLFVARVARFRVESADQNVRMEFRQDFKSGRKSFTCVSVRNSVDEVFAILGPAILDRSPETKIGSTVWQFQALLQGRRVGLWNHKVSLFSIADFFDPKRNPARIQWSQPDHEQYRLRAEREQAGHRIILIVDYDRVFADDLKR